MNGCNDSWVWHKNFDLDEDHWWTSPVKHFVQQKGFLLHGVGFILIKNLGILHFLIKLFLRYFHFSFSFCFSVLSFYFILLFFDLIFFLFNLISTLLLLKKRKKRVFLSTFDVKNKFLLGMYRNILFSIFVL